LTTPSQSSSIAFSQTSGVGQCAGFPHLSGASSVVPFWQLLSTLSHVSFGSKQSHVVGSVCCAGVVHGRSSRFPSGSPALIDAL
jgi:hypothetical protein